MDLTVLRLVVVLRTIHMTKDEVLFLQAWARIESKVETLEKEGSNIQRVDSYNSHQVKQIIFGVYCYAKRASVGWPHGRQPQGSLNR